MKLVHDVISRNTQIAAQEILRCIDDGSALGLGFVLVLKGGRYMVNTAGWAAENPTEMRGMLCALDDELRNMVQGRAAWDETI